MFHLLSSIYTDLTTRPRFNVVFLGEESSGKTSLLAVLKERYVDQRGNAKSISQASTTPPPPHPSPPPLNRGRSHDSGANNGAEVQVATSDAGPSQPPLQPSANLPRTRPTVGQNVLDIVAPSLTATTVSPSSSSRIQRLWPAPPPPQAMKAAAAAAAASAAAAPSNWFKRRTSSAQGESFGNIGSSGHSSTSNAIDSTWDRALSTKALIHIWDLGGERSLRSIWREYYAETDCIVYFWDAERAGKGEARERVWQGLVDVIKEEELQGLPLLIVLSKTDAAGPAHRHTPADGDTFHERSSSASLGLQEDDTENDEETGDLSLHAGSQVDKTEEGNDVTDAAGTATSLNSAQSAEDVLESLKAFIQSHIEAYVVERAQRSAQSSSRRSSAAVSARAAGSQRSSLSGKEPASKGEVDETTGKSSADGAAESKSQEAAYVATTVAGDNGDDGDGDGDDDEINTSRDGRPVLFPDTCIVPLSLLTDSGAEGVLRWIIDASVQYLQNR